MYTAILQQLIAVILQQLITAVGWKLNCLTAVGWQLNCRRVAVSSGYSIIIVFNVRDGPRQVRPRAGWSMSERRITVRLAWQFAILIPLLNKCLCTLYYLNFANTLMVAK